MLVSVLVSFAFLKMFQLVQWVRPNNCKSIRGLVISTKYYFFGCVCVCGGGGSNDETFLGKIRQFRLMKTHLTLVRPDNQDVWHCTVIGLFIYIIVCIFSVGLLNFQLFWASSGFLLRSNKMQGLSPTNVEQSYI